MFNLYGTCLFTMSGKISCVKFGPDAKYLAVGSMDDRHLRIYGAAGKDDSEAAS